MINQISFQLVNQLLLFSLGVICIFPIRNLQSSQLKQISENTLARETYFKQEQSEKLRLSLFKKTSAFGLDNLIADWTMLQFLQYFGDSDARDATGYSLSADYLEVITENDPLFSRAYLIISPASSMFAGTPERTVAIMNQGLAKMSANTPDAYYLWLYKGVDEVLFLGNLPEAQKSYLQASEWAKVAGNDFIRQSASDTAEFLTTKPEIKATQVSVWFMVWVNNKDERIRKIAQAKIESMGGELKIYPDGRVGVIPPKISQS
jgi:hypothetical protein